MVGQHVLSFSADGKLFAIINDQGVLKIWDTATNELKQEYTPNLHLAGPCTALTWVNIVQHHKSKKKRISNVSEEKVELLYLALGTSKGRVSLYSYAEGKIERELNGEGHIGKVTSITQDNAGNLYSCGEDCQIVVWSISDQKRVTSWSTGNEKPYSILYLNQSETVVIGARQIKVFSVATKELLQTFTGHTSNINILKKFVLNHNNEYIVSTSRTERFISLWKIGKKERNKSTTCTLLLEDVAQCISCHVDGVGTIKVAAVTRNGVTQIFQIHEDLIKSGKPIKPKVNVEVVSDNTNSVNRISAISVSMEFSAMPNELLLGYGDQHFMLFEHIEPNYMEKINVLVRTDPKKLYLGKSHQKERAHDLSQKTLTPIINTESVEYKSSITSRKTLKPIEIPMELRLQNLNIATEVTGAPQAQSKVQLLKQALHSKDATLLRSVLCTKDVKVIQLTLQKLPVQYVDRLVNELTLLMQKKNLTVEFASKWLKMLTQTHSSELIALGGDDLLNKLGPCVGLIEHRHNGVNELTKLSGRLQLLVSQIRRNAEEIHLNNDTDILFEDKDSSNSETDEEINEQNGSNDDWEDFVDDEFDENEENKEDDANSNGEVEFMES